MIRIACIFETMTALIRYAFYAAGSNVTCCVSGSLPESRVWLISSPTDSTKVKAGSLGCPQGSINGRSVSVRLFVDGGSASTLRCFVLKYVHSSVQSAVAFRVTSHYITCWLYFLGAVCTILLCVRWYRNSLISVVWGDSFLNQLNRAHMLSLSWACGTWMLWMRAWAKQHSFILVQKETKQENDDRRSLMKIIYTIQRCNTSSTFLFLFKMNDL